MNFQLKEEVIIGTPTFGEDSLPKYEKGIILEINPSFYLVKVNTVIKEVKKFQLIKNSFENSFLL